MKKTKNKKNNVDELNYCIQELYDRIHRNLNDDNPLRYKYV